MSLKKELLTRLVKEVKPLAGGTLEDIGRELGYKASTAGRRLRELAQVGLIIPNYDNGYVEYSISDFYLKSRENKINGFVRSLQVLPEQTPKTGVDTGTVQLCFAMAQRKSPCLLKN